MTWNDQEIRESYTSCYPQIVKLALQFGKQATDARDIFQDTLYTLLENEQRGNVEKKAALCTYLYSITFNRLNNLAKKEKSSRAVKFTLKDIDEIILKYENKFAELSDEEKNYHEMLLNLLDRCIQQLNEAPQKIATLLKGGLRGSEIWQQLSYKTYAAYRVQQSHCFTMLRNCVNGKQNNEY